MKQVRASDAYAARAGDEGTLTDCPENAEFFGIEFDLGTLHARRPFAGAG